VTFPRVVSRDEWLVARQELLEKEKEATRARDTLNAQRRELPMVEIDKPYVFKGPDGVRSLLDLFEGRRQLVVYHFMFGPDWEDEGCASCSFLVDNIGHLSHLHSRDTSLAVVSRAPLDKIEPFKKRMGWTFPWYSSFGAEFNYDFHVTLDEEVTPVEYNYRDKAELERLGMPWHTTGEQHGVSVFFRDGERVLHSYSTYGRGPELLLGTYSYLDLTPLGRMEEGTGIVQFRHHDTYDL
jgi:predicted dithiol-disulfide oxidoreductase (DUF899 family)